MSLADNLSMELKQILIVFDNYDPVQRLKTLMAIAKVRKIKRTTTYINIHIIYIHNIHQDTPVMFDDSERTAAEAFTPLSGDGALACHGCHLVPGLSMKKTN